MCGGVLYIFSEAKAHCNSSIGDIMYTASQQFTILKAHDFKLNSGLLIGMALADILNKTHEAIQWQYSSNDAKHITLILDDYRGHTVYLTVDHADVLNFDVKVIEKDGSAYDLDKLKAEVIDFTMMDLCEGLEGIYYGA